MFYANILHRSGIILQSSRRSAIFALRGHSLKGENLCYKTQRTFQIYFIRQVSLGIRTCSSAFDYSRSTLSKKGEYSRSNGYACLRPCSQVINAKARIQQYCSSKQNDPGHTSDENQAALLPKQGNHKSGLDSLSNGVTGNCKDAISKGDRLSSQTQIVEGGGELHDDEPLVPYRLWKADVEAIIWRFKSESQVKQAAHNQGLDDFQFKETANSLRKGLLKAMRHDFELHSVMCAIDSGKAHVHELFPYFLKEANALFPMRNCNLEELKKISDLRGPHDLFPRARKIKRRIIYHAGPTNSGKTYQALERFRNSKSGVYCAPLRLLAGEVYRKTIEAGVLCDLITGEERLWATSAEEPSSHIACTMEMSSTMQHYECAVIDEIQMMRDAERGWAWTRALLGLISDEVHVCGEDTAIDLVRRLAEVCGDELEVCRYQRLGPLHVLPYSLGGKLHHIRPGDCVVAFSQREIFKLRQRIERTTGRKCAMVYGGLPSATRVAQASKFNNPDDDHKILVASDAIGMGLNLNIKRIVFHAVEKFDGHEVAQLTPSLTKQIAGRAGRFGSEHPKGEVTTLYGSSLGRLKNLMKQPCDKVKSAGLSPSLEQIEMLSRQLPNATLANLMEVFLEVAQLDGQNYFMCDLDNVQLLAEMIEGIPLTIMEQYSICQAPVSLNRPLSSSLIVEFARHVSRGEEIRVEDLKTLIGWPPSMPRSLKGLQDVEGVHEICDVYLWLSYRFPEVFVDDARVRKMQTFVERIIAAAVTSNLKQRGMPGIVEGQQDDDDRDNTDEHENDVISENENHPHHRTEGLSPTDLPRDPAVLHLSYKDFKRLRDATDMRSPTLRFSDGRELPVVIGTTVVNKKPRTFKKTRT